MPTRGGRIQIALRLFVPCGLRAGALVANCFAVGRTIGTRIFSRLRDRFSIWINKLKPRNQSVLRSVLKNQPFMLYYATVNCPIMPRSSCSRKWQWYIYGNSSVALWLNRAINSALSSTKVSIDYNSAIHHAGCTRMIGQLLAEEIADDYVSFATVWKTT